MIIGTAIVWTILHTVGIILIDDRNVVRDTCSFIFINNRWRWGYTSRAGDCFKVLRKALLERAHRVWLLQLIEACSGLLVMLLATLAKITATVDNFWVRHFARLFLLSLALFLTLIIDLCRILASCLSGHIIIDCCAAIYRSRGSGSDTTSPARIVIERLLWVAVSSRIIIVHLSSCDVLIRVRCCPIRCSSGAIYDTTLATGNGLLLFMKLKKWTTEHNVTTWSTWMGVSK